MSHGYTFTCDHCKTQAIVAAREGYRYSRYDPPAKWLEIKQEGANTLNFCSKKCVIKFASNAI